MSYVRNAAAILWATLREIFDEAPYARFLARSNQPASRESYAAFWKDREQAHARKPRCC